VCVCVCVCVCSARMYVCVREAVPHTAGFHITFTSPVLKAVANYPRAPSVAVLVISNCPPQARQPVSAKRDENKVGDHIPLELIVAEPPDLCYVWVGMGGAVRVGFKCQKVPYMQSRTVAFTLQCTSRTPPREYSAIFDSVAGAQTAGLSLACLIMKNIDKGA
jgi:hypothetical protein